MPDDSSFLPYKNFIVILIPKPFNLSPLQSNGEYENVLGQSLIQREEKDDDLNNSSSRHSVSRNRVCVLSCAAGLNATLTGLSRDPLSSYHFCQLFDGSIWFDFTLLAFLNCTYSKLLANRLTRGTIQVGLFSTICAAMGGLIAFPPIPTFVLCL
ncbi:hypothetical protein K443DRAFT_155830 [Laccaria amethystina LaAM-08-1]|uniref:Uncharacterized protein n=1 Tax=Laccaria amethystina LaAM-08-1 TaxID=1095629 RepID=A0A0C9WPJ1_9AGAR|nr:hypothetical protein K443DRAFT_155830 [Laccaria amethystina LaAM-08-1]